MVFVTMSAYGVAGLGIYPVASAGSIWCAFNFSLPYDGDHPEVALWEVRGQGNGKRSILNGLAIGLLSCIYVGDVDQCLDVSSIVAELKSASTGTWTSGQFEDSLFVCEA